MIKRIIKKLLKIKGFKLVRSAVLPTNIKLLNQFSYFSRMFTHIFNIEGDIVECGIGKGKSFFLLALLIQKENRNRNLWGFDSFEGFPTPHINDNSFRNPKKGEWKEMSMKDILAILKKAGISREFIESNIKLIKGFFNKTLQLYSDNPIAFLHIDVDLYESYKIVLEEFFPKVTIGGVILFDEYRTEKWPGATKAIDEYFEKKDQSILYDEEIDKYYIVKK